MKDLISWANNNDGFISLLSLLVAVLLLILGWVTGFFKWIYKKIHPMPHMTALAIVGAKYPQEITFEFENLTDKKILVYKFEAKINTGDMFLTKDALPIVLEQGKNKVKVVSEMSGSSKEHTKMTVCIEFGFANETKHAEHLAWPISDSSMDTGKKYILP